MAMVTSKRVATLVAHFPPLMIKKKTSKRAKKEALEMTYIVIRTLYIVST